MGIDGFMQHGQHHQELITQFEQYLIQNDGALYYNIRSVVLAIHIVNNLLRNLTGTMKRSVVEMS